MVELKAQIFSHLTLTNELGIVVRIVQHLLLHFFFLGHDGRNLYCKGSAFSEYMQENGDFFAIFSLEDDLSAAI